MWNEMASAEIVQDGSHSNSYVILIEAKYLTSTYSTVYLSNTISSQWMPLCTGVMETSMMQTHSNIEVWARQGSFEKGLADGDFYLLATAASQR